MGQSCTRDASIDNDGVVSTHRTTPPPTTSSSSPAGGLAIPNKRRRRTASTSTTSTSSNNINNNSYSTNRKRSDGGTTTNYGDTTVNATEDEDVLSTDRDERKRSGGTPSSLGGGCVEGTISSRDVIVLTGSGTEQQQQQTPSLHNNNNNQEINSSGKDQSLVPVMVDKNQSISLSEATGRLTSGSASASLRSASLLGEDEGGVSIGSAIIGGGGRRRRRVLATGYIPGSISSTTSAFGKGSPALGVVGSPATSSSINSRGGGGSGGVRSSTMYSSIVNRVSPSELLKMSPTEAEERSPVIRGRRSRGHHPQQILPSQTNHHVGSRSGSQAMIDGVVGVSSGSNGGGGGVFNNSFPASAGTSKRRSIPSGSNGSSAAIEDSPATKLLFGSAPEEEEEEAATMMKLEGTHPPPLIRQRTAGQNGMEGSLNHHNQPQQQTLQLHTSVLEAPRLMSALPNNSQQLQQIGESTTPTAHPPLAQTAATSSSSTTQEVVPHHPLTTIFIPAEASGDLDSDHTSTTIPLLPNAISISASSPLAAAAVRPANGYHHHHQSSSSSAGFITDMGMLSSGGIRGGLVLGGSGSTTPVAPLLPPSSSSTGALVANGTADRLYQSIQTFNTGSSDGSDIGDDELLLNGSFVNTDMRAIAGLSDAMVAHEMAMMEESGGGGGGGGDSSAAVSCTSMSEKKMRSRARSRARSIRQVLAASLSAKNSTSPMRQQPYSCNVVGGGMDTLVDPVSGGDEAQPHNTPLPPSISNDNSNHNQFHPHAAPQQQQQSHHHHNHQNQQHMVLAFPSLVESNTQNSKRSSIVDTGAVTPNIHSEGGGGASFTTMEVFNDIVPIGLVVDSSSSPSSQLNR